MTPQEIIQAHAQKQGVGVDRLAQQVVGFLKQPSSTVARDGDCLFLIRNINGTAFFYILNGGNAGGYMRALKSGLGMLQKMGYEKAAMRVADKEKSKKIAASVGVGHVSYKEVGGKADPYLMTMEL